jgi:hypothetical protein
MRDKLSTIQLYDEIWKKCMLSLGAAEVAYKELHRSGSNTNSFPLPVTAWVEKGERRHLFVHMVRVKGEFCRAPLLQEILWFKKKKTDLNFSFRTDLPFASEIAREDLNDFDEANQQNSYTRNFFLKAKTFDFFLRGLIFQARLFRLKNLFF